MLIKGSEMGLFRVLTLRVIIPSQCGQAAGNGPQRA